MGDIILYIKSILYTFAIVFIIIIPICEVNIRSKARNRNIKTSISIKIFLFICEASIFSLFIWRLFWPVLWKQNHYRQLGQVVSIDSQTFIVEEIKGANPDVCSGAAKTGIDIGKSIEWNLDQFPLEFQKRIKVGDRVSIYWPKHNNSNPYILVGRPTKSNSPFSAHAIPPHSNLQFIYSYMGFSESEVHPLLSGGDVTYDNYGALSWGHDNDGASLYWFSDFWWDNYGMIYVAQGYKHNNVPGFEKFKLINGEDTVVFGVKVINRGFRNDINSYAFESYPVN